MASGKLRKLNNLETLLEKESKGLVEKLRKLRVRKGKLKVKDIRNFTNQLRTLMEYYTSDNNYDSRYTLSIENPSLYQRMLIYDLHNFLPEPKKGGRKLTRRPEIDEAIGDGFTLDELSELTDPKITRERIHQYLNSTNQHERWKKHRQRVKESRKKEYLEEYREKYQGKTRGQLDIEDKALYNKMRYHGLLEHVPLSKPMSDEEILREYKTNYEGKTRGQLQKEDKALYEKMGRRGLLEHVPLKRKIKPY